MSNNLLYRLQVNSEIDISWGSRQTKTNACRRFQTYVAQHPDLRFGGPRFDACIAVTQDDVDAVLNGPGPEVFTIDDTGLITLIALEEEDGEQCVGFPLIFPRVYSLIDGLGWDHIWREEDYFAE